MKDKDKNKEILELYKNIEILSELSGLFFSYCTERNHEAIEEKNVDFVKAKHVIQKILKHTENPDLKNIPEHLYINIPSSPADDRGDFIGWWTGIGDNYISQLKAKIREIKICLEYDGTVSTQDNSSGKYFVDPKEGLGILHFAGKEYALGSIKNIPYKILKYIDEGIDTDISTAYEKTCGKQKAQTSLTTIEKMSILNTRMAELQDTLNAQNAFIKFKFQKGSSRDKLRLVRK